MRFTPSIAGWTLLLLGAVSLTQAWVPSSSLTTSRIEKPLQRLSTRLGAEKRRFAQAQTAKKKYNGENRLASDNEERIRNAGRKGTKRFVDPCKVFVGNMPFDVDDEKLTDFILGTMGQSRLVLHSSKVIHEWKTGKSKGFGFVIFTDPMYATVCMEVCNGKKLDGRTVTVSQGKKKAQDNQLYLKKKRKKAETAEDAAIASALDEAESDVEDIPVFGDDGEDLELDAKLFGLIDDDDDGEDDGIFLENRNKYEDIDPAGLNREQRRDAGRRQKRKKAPTKGFGRS